MCSGFSRRRRLSVAFSVTAARPYRRCPSRCISRRSARRRRRRRRRCSRRRRSRDNRAAGRVAGLVYAQTWSGWLSGRRTMPFLALPVAGEAVARDQAAEVAAIEPGEPGGLGLVAVGELEQGLEPHRGEALDQRVL